jgi:uncharacterized membrane protein YpjA
MMEASSLINLLIEILVVGLIFGLIWWVVEYCNVPEPFNKVIRVILAVAAVLFLINLLLGFAGHPFVR